MNKKLGIYIHIPFCYSRCYYCDFVSFTNIADDCISKYIDAVCSEILQYSEILSEYDISSIYFGGGTPSFIDSKYIVKILDTLKLFLKDDMKNIEVTIEANPNSITESKIKDYVSSGINRISIGLQSTDDTILKKIGRAHTYNDFLNALNICKKYSLKNISVDLIYPLPDLDINKFNFSLNLLMNLKDEFNIKHISIYNLELHEGTKLDFLIKQKYEKLVDEDEEMQMKRLFEKILSQNGYINYEISNFACKGFESKHNLNYWNQGQYLGFGVNASSFFVGSRYTNTSDLNQYIQDILDKKSVVKDIDQLDMLALIKEYIILKLRLKDGFNVKNFKLKFGVDVYSLFKTNIKKMIDLKLLQKQDDNIFLTPKGKDLANIVWEEFI